MSSRCGCLSVRAWLLAPVLGAVFAVAPGHAQETHAHQERHVTADGVRLDFAEDGVWRVPARRVVETRQRLRAERRFDALNAARSVAPAQAPGGGWSRTPGAVGGVMQVPTILLAFADTDLATTFATAAYQSLLYGTGAPFGRPYTLRSYYEEVSGGVFSVQGEVYGWVQGPEPEAYYTDACGFRDNGSRINALDCPLGRSRFGELMEFAILALDDVVDYSRYDGTGDGRVDLIQFLQPVLAGECGGPGMWAHRWQLRLAAGAQVQTADGVRVNDYTIQSGLGGPSCSGDQIMGVGTVAHELGHGLGLPDLYDTSGQTSAVGAWDLMASGSWYSQFSPTHMGAWSKEQLGWVTVRELTLGGDYGLGPVIAGDTVLLIRPRASNPRGEYFLLENRQRLKADTTMLKHPRGPGLLVWHVDSVQVATRRTANMVNQGPLPAIHGVAVVQADGLNDLRVSGSEQNAGDAGDPFPGATGQSAFGANTTPAAVLNDNGQAAGLQLEGIRQVTAGGAMAFNLAMAGDLVVQADHPDARVRVDDVATSRWHGALFSGESITLDIDSLQTSADGRSAFEFQSWSNGGARTQTITGPADTDIIEAAVLVRHRLRIDRVGAGGVLGAPAGALGDGAFVGDGQAMVLVAEPADGYTFHRWTGDVTGTSDTLRLSLTGPTDITAEFRNWAPLVVFASQPEARVRVDGTASARWEGQLRHGESRALSIDSLQIAPDGERAFGFVAWSNGGARSHAVTGPLGTDSVLATVDLRWRTRVRVDGQGAVEGAPGDALADGAFVLDGDVLTLVATPADGHYFDRWSGDGTGTDRTLAVTASRAQQVTATFLPHPDLAPDVVIDHLLGLGHGLSADHLAYLDRFGNQNGRLDVGDVLAWLRRTGGPQAQAAAARLQASPGMPITDRENR